MVCPNCGDEEIEFTQMVGEKNSKWYVYEHMACWFRIYYCPYCGVKLKEKE